MNTSARGRCVALREMVPDDLPRVMEIDRAAHSDPWPARVYKAGLRDGRLFLYVAMLTETDETHRAPGTEGPRASRPTRSAPRGLPARAGDRALDLVDRIGVLRRWRWRARRRLRLVPPMDNRLIGFAWVSYGEELALEAIAVDPEHEGTGVGQHLLLECFRLARKAGLDRIVLEVRASNERAQRLYRYFGFRERDRSSGFYRDNAEDAVVMVAEGICSAGGQAYLEELRRAHDARYSQRLWKPLDT